MRKIKAFIVDDESSAINVLKGMLTEFCEAELEVVGTASNEKEAIVGISQHRPDLVFLDIEISPLTNGIDLIGRFPERNFGIIITSAYDQYAIKAMNTLQPWGYLVKPVAVSELILLVKNAIKNIEAKERLDTTHMTHNKDAGIIVSDAKKGNIAIKAPDLLYCKAENALVFLHYFAEGKLQKIAIYKSLKELELLLPESFFRIHNNTIVNMSYINRYEVFGRTAAIYLPNNLILDVSVSKLSEFQDRFAEFIKRGS